MKNIISANVIIIVLLGLLLLLSSCSTTSEGKKSTDSYTNYKSKIEVLEETHLKEGKFLGNTNVKVIYKNYDALVREKSYEGKETDRKKEYFYNYETESEIPAGGHIEFEIEAASIEGANVGQFEISLFYGTNEIKYSKDKITFATGSKFSNIDEKYNIEIFKNSFIVQIKRKTIKPFELKVIDNHIKKLSRFKIFPYVSQ